MIFTENDVHRVQETITDLNKSTKIYRWSLGEVFSF